GGRGAPHPKKNCGDKKKNIKINVLCLVDFLKKKKNKKDYFEKKKKHKRTKRGWGGGVGGGGGRWVGGVGGVVKIVNRGKIN
ncbi:hypothetical protein ACSTLJ_00240, partial [Vibrio parahaemolyticus]